MSPVSQESSIGRRLSVSPKAGISRRRPASRAASSHPRAILTGSSAAGAVSRNPQGISNASKKKTNGPAPTHPCRHRPEMWCLISPNATGSSSSTTCSTRNSLRASWKGRGLRRGMSARSLRMMRFVRSAGKKSAADWLSGYFSSSTRTARQGSASRPRCPKP